MDAYILGEERLPAAQEPVTGRLEVVTFPAPAVPIIVTPSDLLYDHAGAFAASRVVAAASRVLVGMTVRSNSAALGYLFVWNAAAVPGGASTVGPWRVPANTEISIGFGDGIRFATGICWAHSTGDQGGYVLGAANFLVTTVYR